MNHAGEYEDLFNAIGESIFVVDSETGEIVDANAHASRRLGYTHDELVGMNIEAIEEPLPQELSGPSLWKSTFTRIEVYECLHRRKDGTTYPVEISSRLIQQGEKHVLLNLARDNTIRKELEAERAQLIEDLEDYAHVVAHDLRNPASILVTYCHVLNEELGEASTEQLRDYSQRIVAQSYKLLNIIDSLLMLASLRPGEDLTLEPVDLGDVVDEVLNRLSMVIDQYDAQIILPEAWPRVAGHGQWLEEVIANYLSNAIKYGGQPPVVEMGTTGDAGSGEFQFWVKDNGEGILPEQQDQLFTKGTRFLQAKADGHGLGLSVVKRIIERLDGEVSVVSAPGEGSTFFFTLPAG